MATGSRRRVVAIGLDAASMPFIDALIGDGRLPNFAGARASSARWDIDGGFACVRNLQWMQFNFGRRMESDCGAQFIFDPARYRCELLDAPRRFAGAQQFWDRPDVNALVFDVPESALVDGYASVTGWGGHAPRFPRSSSPAGLIEELDREVGVHRGLANDYDPAWHDRGAIKALADALAAGAGRRARAFCHLLRRFPDWDLALAVMSELHSAGHFWIHATDPDHPLQATRHAAFAGDQLARVYEAVDAALGEMVAAAPAGTAIVLFSHDDMRPGHADGPSLVLLPELLHRMHDGNGLLSRIDADSWKATGCPPVVPRNGLVWRDHVDGELLDPPPRSWLGQHPRYRQLKLSRGGRWLIEKLRGRPVGAQGNPIEPESVDGVLDPERRRAVDTNDILFTRYYQPHWSHMRAFALPGYTAGGVRLNLIERERVGLVPLEDYESFCDQVEAEVRACTNPRTGNSVVRHVLRPRRDDPLDPAGDVVDLVFVWAEELIDAFEHPTHGLMGPIPAHRPGVHDMTGFLYVQAEGVDPGERGHRPAWDIPPTLLDLVGAAQPEHVDGASVLDGAGIRMSESLSAPRAHPVDGRSSGP